MDSATLVSMVEEWLFSDWKARDKYGNISDWDVSGVTNFDNLFYVEVLYGFGDDDSWRPHFDADLSKRDVSSALSMNAMFKNTASFNSDISKWNTASVTSMGSMFMDAASFNSDITKWITS